MNISVEKLLEDIDALKRKLRESGALSAIERDILLQRIRDLYEAALNAGSEGPMLASAQEKVMAEISSLELPAGEKISHTAQPAHADGIPMPEKISFHHEDMSIAGVMQHRKISTMKEAIGLNEKFLFIRELFNNETDSYQRCVEKIDAATSLSEATGILDAEYAAKYSWNKEGNAYFHFTSLVERRFV